MSVIVATGFRWEWSRTFGTDRSYRATQSGQWKPTAACTMQSGQIGWSHRWQVTPARRPGWR
jgi:hypothetical protein